MKILVIANNYPSNTLPTYGVFVYNIVQQFAKLGHEVTVIANRSIWKKSAGGPEKETNLDKDLATVYYPKTISASNKQIFSFNTHLIGEKFAVRAIKKVVNKNKLEFDVVYAHFLVCGFFAAKALFNFGKPIFVAEGELKNINLRKTYYKPNVYSSLLSKIVGFIAVSPQIKDNLIEVGVSPGKIIIQPNAVDSKHFYKRDKIEMRKKHGLPLDKKLVIFVGRFVEDKGPLRVLKAIEKMENVSIIYIGGGSQNLESDKIVFKDKVTIDLVPELLSAADVFALPTLHEGSCNAIIEAMACGLPIVSSDIPEIRFQCESSSSILVDPMNVVAIEKAIYQVISNENKQKEMSKAALEYSKQFEITKRAESILEFLKDGL